MKKKYVRPMMKAETYQVNSYIAACTTLKDGSLTVSQNDSEGPWYKKNLGPLWDGSGEAGNLKDQIANSVTFSGDTQLIVGSNGQAVGGYYWTSGEYYLEYSDYWSGANHADTYFLYKETNSRKYLQISGGDGAWPEYGQAQGYRRLTADLCVAQVVYKENTTIVGS